MKFAIVGSGSIAQRYATIISQNFDAEISIVSDFQPSFFQTFDVRGRLESRNRFRELSTHFDAIIIASVNNNHLNDFYDFSKFSNFVLIEKPLYHQSLSKNEFQRLNDYDGKLMVSSPLRFHAGFALVAERLKSVGGINHIEVRCQSWLPSWRPGRDFREGFWNDHTQGGVLREIIHELDYLGYLFGDLQVEWIAASTSKWLDLNVESGVSAILRTKVGEFIDLRLDFCSHNPRRHIRIDGDLGTLNWNVLTGSVDFGFEGKVDNFHFTADLDRNGTFKRQIDALLDASSWKIPGTTLEEASHSLNLVEEMYKRI